MLIQRCFYYTMELHLSKGIKYNAPNVQKNPMWSTITVDTILKNCVYVGDLVQGRRRVKSYKIHVQERVSEDEWFIVGNTHEPIIDREAFDKIQKLLKRIYADGVRYEEIFIMDYETAIPWAY